MIKHLFDYVKKRKNDRKHMGYAYAQMHHLLTLQDGLTETRYKFLFDFDKDFVDKVPFMDYIS